MFQEVIAPLSKRIAKLAQDASRPVVKGCMLANLVATPATLVGGSLPELQSPPPPATSGAPYSLVALHARKGAPA